MEKYKKYEPIFGSWYLVKLLGRGSFGNVYEIVREEYGVQYKAALKIISVPQDEDDIKVRLSVGSDRESISEYYEEILKDIVNENEIMSRLKGNSNIVSYEDHQIIPHEDGIGYDILIRMELLTPLLDRMLQGNLAESDVVKLGIDMCNALELCHKRNIIHRDIKPQNIFISEDGDYKLGDFGIARSIEKTTGGMSRKGTYNYMAPEVFRGDEYDSTVDIYSLGVVLYSLLNGNRGPFLPPTPEKITPQMEEDARNKRFKGKPLPNPAGATPLLSHIILKACDAEPNKRYENASQMKRDLELYYTNHINVTEAMAFISQGEKTEVDFFKDYSSPHGIRSNNTNVPNNPTKRPGNNKYLVLIAAGLVLALLIIGGSMWNYIREDNIVSNEIEEETPEETVLELPLEIEVPEVLRLDEVVIGSWQSENGYGWRFNIGDGGTGTTDFYDPNPTGKEEKIKCNINVDGIIEIQSDKAKMGKIIFSYDQNEDALWLDANEASAKYIRKEKAVSDGDLGDGDSEFKVGKSYILLDNMFVRSGAEKAAKAKSKNDLSPNAIPFAFENDNGEVLLKKGTEVDCLQVKGDWIRINSGWICGREGSKAYIEEK